MCIRKEKLSLLWFSYLRLKFKDDDEVLEKRQE